MSDWLWLLVIGGGLYLLSKSGEETVGSPSASGLGVGGSPRRGVPKTEAERLASHRARYGESSLPPRGTGLYRQSLI